MKTAVNIWAFDPRLDIQGIIKEAKCANFNALELNYGNNSSESFISLETSNRHIQEMSKVIAGEGIQVSSICTELFWQYSLSSGIEKEKQKALEIAARMIETANILNALSVVVIPGIVHAPKCLRHSNSVEYSQAAWHAALESVSRIAAQARDADVVVGIENVYFNKFLLSPLELKVFIKQADSPYVKAHLDLGNANISGIVDDWIVTLDDLVFAVHVKDSMQGDCSIQTFRPPGLGSIDWKNVKEAFRRTNFNGYYILEQSYSNIKEKLTLVELNKKIKCLCVCSEDCDENKQT